ncbi:hypothetical protein MHU86_19077 [Fragilaria crotonensis]|nr:hypothetical protein MHU86_19077 [Fragilaria crotonensis]
MDERVMHLWIERILKPYVDQAPPGIVPLLLLDSYRCHMMKSTVNAIEDLGVEVEHIPGGCTSLCQPVDVGVNKPFKSRLRKLWEEWMISTGLHQGKIDPPTRKHIAEWCSTSCRDLPAQMVRNAWRHGTYSYYPSVQEEEHAADQRQEDEHAADDDEVNTFVRNGINCPVEQQVNSDDESRDENDDDASDDDEMLRNHSSLSFLTMEATSKRTTSSRRKSSTPPPTSRKLTTTPSETETTILSSSNRLTMRMMGVVIMSTIAAMTRREIIRSPSFLTIMKTTNRTSMGTFLARQTMGH